MTTCLSPSTHYCGPQLDTRRASKKEMTTANSLLNVFQYNVSALKDVPLQIIPRATLSLAPPLGRQDASHVTHVISFPPQREHVRSRWSALSRWERGYTAVTTGQSLMGNPGLCDFTVHAHHIKLLHCFGSLKDSLKFFRFPSKIDFSATNTTVCSNIPIYTINY